MGFGDSIMATARARRQAADTGKRVAIGDGKRIYWDDQVFRGNPYLAVAATETDVWLHDYPGRRPYIDYAAMKAQGIPTKGGDRWIWKADCPPPDPGALFLTPAEFAFAAPHARAGRFVLIEPHVKAKASPNKDWGFDRWQAVARILVAAGVDVLQPGPPGVRVLDAALHVPTKDFRQACALLSAAAVYAGPEGGLHHAAAALGVPAVVVFGGYISPRLTGYGSFTRSARDAPRHLNFAAPEACGMRIACEHCKDAMAAIQPSAVADSVLERFIFKE